MTEIKIKDLRGVGDVELNLDDTKRVFVFFGSNGVGKTKTLEALFLFLLGKVKDFSTPFHSKFHKKLFENMYFNNDIMNLTDNLTNDLFNKISNKEFLAIAYLGANSRSDVYKNRYSQESFGEVNQRKQIFSNLIGEFFLGVNDYKLSQFGMSQDINKWFTERAKSVNPYQKEEDNRKVDIDTVLNALHILDNRIEKTLKIDGDGNVFLTIEGQERELSELSSGFISVVKIIQSIISAYSAFTNATDLLNVKGVVLIDEIESHLHIEWQTKIVPTLKNLFPNTTFYIATHSPLVLSQLAEGEAYLLKRDNDNVVRSEKINSPNTRLLANVLQDTFGVDLNTLKRDNMANIDQSQAKQRLLDLLNSEAQP